MDTTDLRKYGFTDRFAALAGEYEGLVPGRVTSQAKGLYGIVTERGERLGTLGGRLRFLAEGSGDLPATGDFVMLDVDRSPDSNAVIRAVLPRKSAFTRKAAGTSREEQVVAANVDTVFICMSLNNDFNVRRLERYLTIGWNSQAVPVVLLTKADLCDDLPRRIAQAESVSTGADVLAVTAMERDGCEGVRRYLADGSTVAIIGSSGVGKSTLINTLLGEDRFLTNGLRDDDKGRHTTTRRELVLLPGGGAVIDTPGMREIGMWDVSEGLDRTFADVEAIAEKCRYKNCSHSGEPGCAVAFALESGELSKERLCSYLKLKTEADFARDSNAYLSQKEKKFKEISKINKSKRR